MRADAPISRASQPVKLGTLDLPIAQQGFPPNPTSGLVSWVRSRIHGGRFASVIELRVGVGDPLGSATTGVVVPRAVSDVLDDHVRLELECVDRIDLKV
jgi:hypothetical protein